MTGACLVELGPPVIGLDLDARKVAALRSAVVPFHEPGLPELVRRGVADGRLRFTTEPREALSGARAAFIAVGTPSQPDGSADLRSLHAAADGVALLAPQGALVVVRSTGPPGTGDGLEKRAPPRGGPTCGSSPAGRLMQALAAEGARVRAHASKPRCRPRWTASSRWPRAASPEGTLL